MKRLISLPGPYLAIGLVVVGKLSGLLGFYLLAAVILYATIREVIRNAG